MKQLLQDLSDGTTHIVEAPAPVLKTGYLVIESSLSLISSGTERMIVSFGKGGLISKARQQPERVKEVLEKIRTDGVLQTIDVVRSKLQQPIPLGYSNVGVVSGVGADVDHFKIGDRVVSNGRHADIVRVPKNLCAKIPDNVSDEEAAFTVVGSISLQGVRLAEPTIGETFAVIGAGLIGLLSVQILRANGCQVIAVDFDKERLAIAQEFGAQICNLSDGEDPVALAHKVSGGRGIDGVLIAAATSSSDPFSQAARMVRKRGRVILTGVAGMQLNRSDFYEKEIRLQVSCSYGPGRYDPEFEEQGNDYPIGFVRWTEKRNFEAILQLLSDKAINVSPLISNRFAFEDASEAYESLCSGQSALGILLEYQDASIEKASKRISLSPLGESMEKRGMLTVSFIGCGNYASRILIPAFKRTQVTLNMICSSSGTPSAYQGRRFGFREAVSDAESIIEDKTTDIVVIATQHDSHAIFVAESLRNGKSVFVEKPLAISHEGLDAVKEAYRSAIEEYDSPPVIMIGFNRRFSPLVIKMKSLLDSMSDPKAIIITVNAGLIPESHWTQNRSRGGGRIVGEACHFIDLLRFMTGHPICRLQVLTADVASRDVVVIQLEFVDGSIGTIHYYSNGHKSVPKERIEAFCGGRVIRLDNYLKLHGFGWPNFKRMKYWRQAKGQSECVQEFVNCKADGRGAPISFEEIVEVSSYSIEAQNYVWERA